jgi:hypothetical protein
VTPIVVGIFSALAALIAAAAGATLLFPGTPLDVIWSIRQDDTHQQMLALGWPVGLGLWIVALVAFICALGSFQRRAWAWWIAVIGMIVNGVSDLGRMATGGVVEGMVGVVVASLIVYWLTRPWFGRSGRTLRKESRLKMRPRK